MSVVYVSFIGIIALIARECACEWQGDFDDGKESVCKLTETAQVGLAYIIIFLE